MQNSNALSAASLINNVISAVEKVRTMVKDLKDRPLKTRELRRELLDQDEEIRKLKLELSQRTAIEGPIGSFSYYYAVGDREHPLCPVCYKARGVEIPLAPLEDWNGGKLRRCDACGFSREEEPMEPHTIRIGKRKLYSSRL